MSKGWTVKVGTQIVVNIDTNIGVVASTEEQAGRVAQVIVNSDLDLNKVDYVAQISAQIPRDFEIAGINWSQSGEPDIDFDTMCALNIEPDSDFDPEGDDEVKEDAAVVRDLMEAAQCLNECFHNLVDDHPLKEWQERHGIAEVRDQLNLCAIYCDNLYRLMISEQGYDLPFDFDFCPQFLENCVDHGTFKPKSENMHILSMYWSGIGA